MNISFHGADREVTGSCHLVTCGNTRILVDCGLYQGRRELHEDNAGPFGFDPTAVDFLILTHAHLDHCGRIPLLGLRGFGGEIITTAASRELARLVLLDSAQLQEEESGHRRRKGRGHRHHEGHGRTGRGRDGRPGPLYGVSDALNAMDHFDRSAVYGEPVKLAPGIRATFFDAGHILGSASVLLELEESGRTRRVLFSGDIGNAGRPLLRDPHPPAGADTVVMETTYGDREHRDMEATVSEFMAAIRETLDRGGNVVIPTFALERAHEILYHLREGVERGELPKDLPVYLDSPMAISATEIFRRHPEAYRSEVAGLFQEGRDPFALPGLKFVRSVSGSRVLFLARCSPVASCWKVASRS